ncbi:MAG: aromatic ring-hydroxylating dioxygenase subunit alpha [Elusimicrobia bacterium]|nr:aromatic ring-hydroxylating dioxygenase subunit alpha [Elusimicrobiota bacterium]
MSLKEYWYIAAESSELASKPLARVVLGERLVLFRGPDGKPAALEDRCAHRNIALSGGKVENGTLRCRYHGWRYAPAGTCVEVPALGETKLPRRACVRPYPCVESQGFVWVYPGVEAPPPAPPAFARLGEPGWTTFTMRNLFEGTVEACMENFLDCPHTVYVHRGWFRTSDPRPLKAVVTRSADRVEAAFEDEPISESVVSRLLFPKGRRLTHTDRFILPAMSRVDYSFGPDRHFIISSWCTPAQDESHTRVYTAITYRFGAWGPLVRLFFEPLCRTIIAQDVEVIAAQDANIRRFGGPRFTHLEIDLLGPHIHALRAARARGEILEPAAGEPVEIRF